MSGLLRKDQSVTNADYHLSSNQVLMTPYTLKRHLLSSTRHPDKVTMLMRYHSLYTNRCSILQLTYRDIHGRRNAICEMTPLTHTHTHSFLPEASILPRKNSLFSCLGQSHKGDEELSLEFVDQEYKSSVRPRPRRNALCEALGSVAVQCLLELQMRLCRVSISRSYSPKPSLLLKDSFQGFDRVMESISFDAFLWSEEAMLNCLQWLLCESRYCSSLALPVRTVRHFLRRVRMGYAKYANPFHCFRHAFDVTSFIVLLLGPIGAYRRLTSLQTTALIVASICHDLEHPGTDFAFQSSISSRLAADFAGTVSPLERHHLACTIALLSDEDCNIFSSLSNLQRTQALNIIRDCILGTDMTLHKEMMEQFTMCFKQPNSKTDAENINNKQHSERDQSSASLQEPDAETRLLLQMLIKAADVGNVVRPWVLNVRWSQCLIDELMRAHDAVIGLGQIPSAFLQQSQLYPQRVVAGFLENVGRPLFNALGQVLPDAHTMISFLETNLHRWNDE